MGVRVGVRVGPVTPGPAEKPRLRASSGSETGPADAEPDARQRVLPGPRRLRPPRRAGWLSPRRAPGAGASRHGAPGAALSGVFEFRRRAAAGVPVRLRARRCAVARRCRAPVAQSPPAPRRSAVARPSRLCGEPDGSSGRRRIGVRVRPGSRRGRPCPRRPDPFRTRMTHGVGGSRRGFSAGPGVTGPTRTPTRTPKRGPPTRVQYALHAASLSASRCRCCRTRCLLRCTASRCRAPRACHCAACPAVAR